MSKRVWREATLSSRARTLREDDFSVEVVATTDAPVKMFDFFGGGFNEVLAMSGVKLPQNKQVPLIDSHDRWSIKNVLGSFQNIKVENNSRLVGRVFFSEDEEAQKAFRKVKEGHLTDFSVGYSVNNYREVADQETLLLEGKEYTGPCKVAVEWELKELSICPIGADPAAKARGEYPGENMKEEERIKLEAEIALRAARAKGKDESEDEEEVKGKKGRKGKEASEDEEEKSEAEEDEEKGDFEDDEEKSESEDEEEKDEDEEEPKDVKSKGKKRRAVSASTIVARERARVRGIEDTCQAFRDVVSNSVRQRFIASGASVNSVREAVLDMLKARNCRGPNSRVQVTRDGTESFRQRAIDGVLARCGLIPKTPTPGFEEFRGRNFTELAKECLRQKGHRDYAPSGMDLMGRALTTTDLPLLLVDTIDRVLVHYFEEAAETWPSWTSEGSVSNFKENTLIEAAIDNEMLPLGEQQEYENTVMLESAQKYHIGSWGRKFTISRQSLINDDLGALIGYPSEMAKGVQRLLADAVYDVFNANIEMGDGKPLFCPEHKNIVNLNGDAVPTMESLTKALYALKTMTDAFNRPLAIRPSFLLFPLSLEAHSEQFFSNQFQVIPAPMGVKNIYYNFASRIYENRLDTQNPLVWYILGPNNTNVKVVYLNGNKSPYVETVDNFNIDGITTKVRFDFGVTAPTWRSMIKVVNTPLS